MQQIKMLITVQAHLTGQTLLSRFKYHTHVLVYRARPMPIWTLKMEREYDYWSKLNYIKYKSRSQWLTNCILNVRKYWAIIILYVINLIPIHQNAVYCTICYINRRMRKHRYRLNNVCCIDNWIISFFTLKVFA